MMSEVPDQWPVHKFGYKFAVHVRPLMPDVTWGQLWAWLTAHFGGISDGAWIDQGDHICFRHEAHARLFMITWFT